MLRFAPAVFAVSDTYQILIEATECCVFSVRVGCEEYFEETNGIAPSLSPIHRLSVPRAVLDETKNYTVCLERVSERRAYFTASNGRREETFSFAPVPREGARIFCVSDAHNRVKSPVRAAKAFGDFDLLVLLGDIPEDASNDGAFSTVFELSAELTHGEKPIVFARGNHDMRGAFAEKFALYTPTEHGNSYYTFHLGSIWGVVLDCGEDKDDGRIEYGPTIACRPFRRRQTRFLKDVIARAKEEYASDGVTTRLVVCHIPFPLKNAAPFNIEEGLYREWCTLLKEEVRPQLFLSGHTHRHGVFVSDEGALAPLPCPVVVTSEPREEEFVGCGVTLTEQTLTLTFTDSEHGALDSLTLIK